MNNNAVAFVFVVIGVVLVAVVGVLALIGGAFYFIFRANTQRSRAAIGDAVERWAEDEGYDLISWKQVDRNRDHPFKNRLGLRVRKRGDYGGVVLRIVVEDADREERAGWLYMPLKGRGGVRLGGVAIAADWRNAEVVWERD